MTYYIKHIISHESAALINQLTSQIPDKPTITVLPDQVKDQDAIYKAYSIDSEFIALGAMENQAEGMQEPLFLYDAERTVCDFIRDKDQIDNELYLEVIATYLKEQANLPKLLAYAEVLGVDEELKRLLHFSIRTPQH